MLCRCHGYAVYSLKLSNIFSNLDLDQITKKEQIMKKSEEQSLADTGPHNINLENWISCAPYEDYLGIKIIQAQKGRSYLTMPFVFDLSNGGGLLHGGAMITLADTAVAMAIKSIVAENSHFATISLKTDFLAPVTQGIVHAKATAVMMENALVKGLCDIYNDTDKKVMAFSSKFKLARGTQVLIDIQ
jgi:acyl-CoA thioesterase